jgi:4-carboxymuconolactone decarboxylase
VTSIMKSAEPFHFPDLDRLPAELREEVLGPRRSLNVYRMIMHTPGVAPAFLQLADALRNRTSLQSNLRELAILRVGHSYGAAYEVHHHERLGRAVGLTEAAICATKPGADASALSVVEKVVIDLVDELLSEHGLGAASRQRALSVLSPNQLADLVLTVGFYQLVCNFLNAFGVPIESQA